MTNENQSNGLATASMVLGIIAIVLSFIPLLGVFSWILAPLGLIFGLIAIFKPVNRGHSITGIATSASALIICLLWASLFVASI